MLKAIINHHIFKEYIIFCLAITFSIFLASQDTHTQKAYVPYASLALYMVLTGHIFILLLSPIVGHLTRSTYKYCFIILCITHIANILSWLGDTYTLNNVIEICWPLPISFMCSWHINREFWKQ